MKLSEVSTFTLTCDLSYIASILFANVNFTHVPKLQSNQVKRTPQESINEFIIQKLNPLLVVDFRLISAFLYV